MTDKKNTTKEKRGVLYAITKGGSSEAIKLRRDATIFGREKGDIIVSDNEVSSSHCQIQNINGVYHLFDMNSTNGTFVNNERVVKCKLNPDDILTVGQSSFRFQLEDESNVRHITTIFKSKDKRAIYTPWLLEKLLPLFAFATPAKFKSISVEQIAKAMIGASLNTPMKSEVYHYPEMMVLNR